jgi:hypothetical protein
VFRLWPRDWAGHIAMSNQLCKLAILRDIKERMSQDHDRRFAKLLKDTEHWFMKGQDKMSYTTEQLKEIDWGKLELSGESGEHWSISRLTQNGTTSESFTVSFGPPNSPRVASRCFEFYPKKATNEWALTTKDATAGFIEHILGQCKKVDDFIAKEQRATQKKWMPLPPMGCGFVYTTNDRISGTIAIEQGKTICEVGRLSALLAHELIKRDGPKHIDVKSKMLTYQLRWPCEEVEQ